MKICIFLAFLVLIVLAVEAAASRPQQGHKDAALRVAQMEEENEIDHGPVVARSDKKKEKDRSKHLKHVKKQKRLEMRRLNANTEGRKVAAGKHKIDELEGMQFQDLTRSTAPVAQTKNQHKDSSFQAAKSDKKVKKMKKMKKDKHKKTIKHKKHRQIEKDEP